MSSSVARKRVTKNARCICHLEQRHIYNSVLRESGLSPTVISYIPTILEGDSLYKQHIWQMRQKYMYDLVSLTTLKLQPNFIVVVSPQALNNQSDLVWPTLFIIDPSSTCYMTRGSHGRPLELTWHTNLNATLNQISSVRVS